MTYTFNSRDSYFAARAQWKTDYKNLSAEIREAKLNVKKTARDFSKLSISQDSSATEKAQYWSASGDCSRALNTKAALRAQARELLNELAAMKVEAASQWQAEHAVVS